jgi:hypothetical protein
MPLSAVLHLVLHAAQHLLDGLAANQVMQHEHVLDAADRRQVVRRVEVGPQQAGEVRAYREAMYEVNLVLTGLQNAIGQALIPVLTELAEFFSSTGPARVKVMQIVMAGIADVFRIVIDTAMTLKDVVMGTFSCIGDAISDGAGKGITAMQLLTNVFAVVKIALLGLELSFVIAFEFIGGLIEGLVANLKLLARVAIAAFNLDWPGVKSAWAQGAADIEAIVDGSATRIAAKAAQISDQMQRAALGQSINEGKKYSAKKPGPAGKLFEGEDKGGDDKKDKSQMSVWEAANAADKAHYELTNGLRLRDLSEDVAYWKQKAGLATTSADDRTKALAKAAQAELALMKKNVAEGKAMSEQVVSEAERAALDGVEFVRAGYESKTALGEVSAAQMLVIERGLEDERADIQRMAQAARIALVEQDPNHSPAALQREKDKLLEVERAHAAKLLGIAQQSRIEQGKFAKDFKGGLEASFAGVIKTFTTGTMTIGSLFRNMGKAILNSMIDVFVKIAAKWAAMQVANLVMSKATAAGEIATEVSKAGAGGVASMAAAPFPLNLTAPAFGASMAALAASFSVASAAGGFDIPAGMNPLTQLHQKEMVLPAEHADTIRGLSSGGGGNINVTISGQQLAGGFFLAHQSELVAALKKARRNFQF